MNVREWSGLALAVAGVALIPVGMYISTKLYVLCLLLAGIGAALFYTPRIERLAQRRAQLESQDDYRSPLPADVHNYTGWRSGGRADNLETSTDSIDSD